MRRKRANFIGSREVVLAEAAARGLLRHPTKAWVEQFITLTVPHDPNDNVLGRIGRVADAWPRFLRRLNRHWARRDVKSGEFFRCLEWTPGDDKKGHPHIHLWLFGPIVYEEYVRDWWEASLLEAGLPVDWKGRLTWPDVKPVDDGEGAAAELIKYLTKDIDRKGTKSSPQVYARVYEAFDGRRVTQSSKGFMGKGKAENRCECGSDLPKLVRIKEREEKPE